jgi:hypothetical protein
LKDKEIYGRDGKSRGGKDKNTSIKTITTSLNTNRKTKIKKLLKLRRS